MQPSNDQSAEQRFRDAFVRLKSGNPIVLPPGTPVSQNNVAKEAECDPSALRKSRYPALINEIQAYVHSFALDKPRSTRQDELKKRHINRSIREAKFDSDRQRDMLASQLLCANATIVELTRKLADAKAKLEELQPQASLIPFGIGSQKNVPK